MGTKSKRNKIVTRIVAFVLAFVVAFTGLPIVNFGKVEVKATVQKAWFPLKNLSVNTSRGVHNSKALDFKYMTLQDYAFAPFDGTIVRKSDSYGNHAVWFKSDSMVEMADGTVDYLTLMLEHGENYHNLYVGQKFSQGQDFYQVGNNGQSNGAHFHMEAIKGTNINTTGYWTRGNKSIEDAFIVNKDMTKRISKTGSYNWRYIEGGVIKESTSIGSSIYISGPVYPTGNLDNGQSFGIRGTIYSTYNLTNVTGTIYNSSGAVVMQKSVNPGKTQYDLKKEINNAMAFNKLSSGAYTFEVTATDSNGTKKEVIKRTESSFSVGSIAQPSLSASPVVGGVNVTLSVPQGYIYYTLDGADPAIYGKRYTAPISLTSSATVKAVTYDASDNKSAIISQYVAVGTLSMPAINTYMGSNALTVNITADQGAEIRYTTNGSEPTTNSPQYYGSFQVTDTTVVKAKAFKSGCTSSSTATVTASVDTPKTPSLSVSGSRIATGDAVRVTWDAQATAYSYTVKLYRDSTVIEEQTVQGNTCVFTLPEAGEYSITATAKNFKGESSESYPPVTVTAMEPSTVVFRDHDETVIATQQVRYGYYAELPVNPSRRGYDFQKWDTNAIYQPIKGDVTATAQYTKKRYIVKFVDEEGKTLAPQQEVLFDESVVLPQDPTIDNDGFAFMGWRCVSTDDSSALDYEHVDANMTLQAVFDWGNKDIPVLVKIKEALQVDSNSYKVSLSMKNWPSAKTYARVLVTLKTSEGKMVKTVTQDITLEANNTTNYVDIDPITLISDKVATQVEVNLVGLDGQKTAGAYSDSVTAKTVSNANTMWSEWSTAVPPAGTVSESKKQYRYRDRSYTTSTASSLAGWTQYGAAITTYGNWGPTYSTTAYPGTSDTLQITGSSTVYHYYHVCCNWYDGKNNIDSISYGSGSHYWHTLDTTSPLPTLRMADKGGRQAYGGKGKASGCSKNFYAWFDNGQTTTYYYQTRSKTISYSYYTWGGWSGFSDTYVAAGNDRQVEERTCYRYKIPLETPADGEDNSGETYTQEGSISTDVDLNGRAATILVYKSTNNDPTENQLEYVGQTTIGEGNAYSFTFKPKETPDEANSNYIVALSIEGQTNLYNIDVIYKTKPEYTVTFYDKDGEELSTCQVEENGSAQVPEAPAVEGYTFVGWDKDTTNVQADRAITAVYKPNEYSIVYVDWEANKIDMMQLSYGTELPNVEVEPMEGKKFLGWDKLLDGKTTVDGHLILEAKYEIDEFTVKFVNADGNVISEQDVAYGQAAVLPESIDAGDKKFLGWSNDDNWWYVTKDITVQPIVVNEETTAAPVCAIEDTYMGGILTLSSGDAETIYYRVEIPEVEDDGQEEETEVSVSENGVPEEETEAEWQIYEEEVLLEAEEAVVSYYATADNKNDSEVVSVDYKYVEVENPYLTTAEVTIPKIIAKAGDTISIPVQLSSNPGLMGTMFEIDYDKKTFTNISVEAGEVFAKGIFDYGIDEENGYIYVLWSGTENSYETGTMFTLSVTANADIAEGKYPMTLNYSQYDTFNDNWDDVKMILPEMSINIGDVTYGDVNEDGSIGNKDVAFIARYLVGKEDLSDAGMSAADVNRDERVDNKDVAKLARYLVGKELEIGVE